MACRTLSSRSTALRHYEPRSHGADVHCAHRFEGSPPTGVVNNIGNQQQIFVTALWMKRHQQPCTRGFACFLGEKNPTQKEIKSGVLVPAGGMRSVVSRDGEDLDLSVVEMVAVEVVCWGGGHAYAGSGSGGVREPLGQRLNCPRIRIRLGCR